MEMTFLIAVICLLAGLAAGIFALRPRAMKSLDVAVDVNDNSDRPEFTLSRSLLLIGPDMDDPTCREQRRELRRILNPLLEAEFKIIEIYGDLAPAENGEPYDWLDNQLLRKTLNAEEDFHLIHVNREGKTSFHSGRPISAEALLHIFDLWDYITEDAGEDLTNIIDEEPSKVAEPAQLTATPALQLPAASTTHPTGTVPVLNGALKTPPLTAKSEPPAPVPAKPETTQTEDDWEGWTIHVNGIENETEATAEDEPADPEEALVASLKIPKAPSQPEVSITHSVEEFENSYPYTNGFNKSATDVTFNTAQATEESSHTNGLNGHVNSDYNGNGTGRLSLHLEDAPGLDASDDEEGILTDIDPEPAEPLRRAPRSVSNAIRRRLDG
ncbi:MAG: hypothetical protein MRY72_05765 [Aquisalinus sp.]|nr:hypothetical protein [Aquisalinus sp.]